MGLGVDFNPTAPRVKAPTKARAPKPKAVVVKESRFTAAEAKPRAGAPRAFAEEAATSKRILAVANRKPPQVHWIIPGGRESCSPGTHKCTTKIAPKSI